MSALPQADGERPLLRLLRAIELSRGRGQRVAGERFEILHQGRSFTFAMAVVRTCLRRGLAEASGEGIVLRAEGIAWLRRALHPEAGYAAQHGETAPVCPGNGSVGTVVNLCESPLSRLYRHRGKSGEAWLDDAQFAAGERLRADFEKAGLQPRIGANWEASVSSGGRGASQAADISDFAVDARKRLDRAISCMGPDLAGVTLDICCFLKGLEQVERERAWPPRSAKLMLRTALVMLARHYGLAGSAGSPSPIRRWGTEDYRPQITSGPVRG